MSLGMQVRSPANRVEADTVLNGTANDNIKVNIKMDHKVTVRQLQTKHVKTQNTRQTTAEEAQWTHARLARAHIRPCIGHGDVVG